MKPLFIYSLKVFSSGEFKTCVTMKFHMMRQFLAYENCTTAAYLTYVRIVQLSVTTKLSTR